MVRKSKVEWVTVLERIVRWVLLARHSRKDVQVWVMREEDEAPRFGEDVVYGFFSPYLLVTFTFVGPV
jgi:hypothetical protein